MTAPSETPPPAEAAAAPQKKEKKERKPQTGPPEGYEKKKQLTKAERRELQEKQRAAKAAAKGDAPDAKKGGDAKKAPGAAAPKGGGEKPPAKESPKPAAPKHTGVLAHLEATSKKKPPSDAHAAVAALGLRYAAGLHDGANERCVAMLAAFKEFVGDYQLAPNTTVNRDLDKKLKPQIQHLIDRRPLSASMGAAVRKLRRCIATLDPEMSAEDAKAALRDEIDAYARERIVLANEAIAKLASEKLRDGDVVVTFGRADAVESALYAAKAA
jgi:translation initiation factor eIF-2B subunit delta